MYKLVLIRHGESEFNRLNLFAGWCDQGNDLSDQGWQDAHQAGKLLKEEGYHFDIAYTSVLKRAINTLWSIQKEMDELWVPVIKTWRLNERHYGALQGLNKKETVEKYGEEKVKIWRRGYDTPPEPLEVSDPRHPSHDPRYAGVSPEELPASESLKTTMERVLPFWDSEITPQIKNGKSVIIAAHGNSLRALIKHLDNISDQDITELTMPVGVPLVYELNEDLSPIRHYFLGDPAEIQAKIDAVVNQTKTK